MAVTIEVKGAKELIAKLTTLQQMRKVIGAIQSEAENLKELLQEYPAKVYTPNRNLYGNSEQAKKNRAGFFFHLKNGDISVPYSRTMDLAGRWQVSSANQGWQAIVGNSMWYGDMVQGSNQTYGHAASGWLTVDKAKTDNEAGIIERITQALEEEVANV